MEAQLQHQGDPQSHSSASEGSDYEDENTTQPGEESGVSVNTVTRNIKRVEWPPKDGIFEAPTRVPLSRRFKTDWKFSEISKTTSSYPFNRGYNPSKLQVESVWRPSEDTLHPINNDRPKVVLKDATEVLVNGVPVAQSHYRMPPGTSRTRKCQETYESILIKEKKV